LAGDAAHAVHPLAGQGLNLGLRDAQALARAVARPLRLGLDPADPETLADYVRARRFETVAMALAFDALDDLFSNRSVALRRLRDFGLAAVNRATPLKRAFARRAAAGVGSAAPPA
ncbi:MAG: FAD-dependent monooxygenase, partial [Hyphomicrobiales bacterium]|nr:FAD-dependent monooxygenase [Hyphomicrobiales bacterium]